MTTATDDNASPTLGLEQAARLIRLGKDAMKDLVDSGEVPALVLNQKHTVLLREDLIAYVRDKGREQAATRRQLAAGRAPRRPAAPVEKPAHRRPPRTALPDLSGYEATGV